MSTEIQQARERLRNMAEQHKECGHCQDIVADIRAVCDALEAATVDGKTAAEWAEMYVALAQLKDDVWAARLKNVRYGSRT